MDQIRSYVFPIPSAPKYDPCRCRISVPLNTGTRISSHTLNDINSLFFGFDGTFRVFGSICLLLALVYVVSLGRDRRLNSCIKYWLLGGWKSGVPRELRCTLHVHNVFEEAIHTARDAKPVPGAIPLVCATAYWAPGLTKLVGLLAFAVVLFANIPSPAAVSRLPHVAMAVLTEVRAVPLAALALPKRTAVELLSPYLNLLYEFTRNCLQILALSACVVILSVILRRLRHSSTSAEIFKGSAELMYTVLSNGKFKWLFFIPDYLWDMAVDFEK